MSVATGRESQRIPPSVITGHCYGVEKKKGGTAPPPPPGKVKSFDFLQLRPRYSGALRRRWVPFVRRHWAAGRGGRAVTPGVRGARPPIAPKLPNSSPPESPHGRERKHSCGRRAGHARPRPSFRPNVRWMVLMLCSDLAEGFRVCRVYTTCMRRARNLALGARGEGGR